jgi:hypothetical protein
MSGARCVGGGPQRGGMRVGGGSGPRGGMRVGAGSGPRGGCVSMCSHSLWQDQRRAVKHLKSTMTANFDSI